MASLIIDFVGVNENFTDFRLEVIANGANHEVAFFNNEERRGIGAFQSFALGAGGFGHIFRDNTVAFTGLQFVLRTGGFGNSFPELEQIVQVPLEFVHRAADACGAGNDAHAGRQLQAVHRLTELLTFFAFNAARDTASAGVVRHQNQVAACQRNERGERCALVAAFFFFNLNDQFLTFLKRITDRSRAHIHAFFEILAGNFFKGEEPVTVFAVVDEAGFKAGFDAGDNTLVDIGFALFTAGCFDINIDELLAINNTHARFFSVRGVK